MQGFVEVYMHLVISGGRVQVGKSVRIIYRVVGNSLGHLVLMLGWGRDCGGGGGGFKIKYHMK